MYKWLCLLMWNGSVASDETVEGGSFTIICKWMGITIFWEEREGNSDSTITTAISV